MNQKNIVCIGGGHGLGRLLKSLSVNPNYHITAIVSTTDNGGSTGRLRKQHGTIAWGDIRYCMNQLVSNTSIQSLLFDHRFNGCGELANHAMGNLMLYAADQLCVRPTDTVRLMNKMLDIDVDILPMSDTSCHLTAMSEETDILYGELEIERSDCPLDLESLGLTNQAAPTVEVLEAIKQSDLIVLAPGSFVTSILPPLLMQELVEAINQSESKLVMFANLLPEQQSHFPEFSDQLNYFRQIGLRDFEHVFWPVHRPKPAGLREYLTCYPFHDGVTNQHCTRMMYRAIEQTFGDNIRAIA